MEKTKKPPIYLASEIIKTQVNRRDVYTVQICYAAVGKDENESWHYLTN